jgi:[lysine-biosynthesis-protein LysW]--L-2-aminoadipate ligase
MVRNLTLLYDRIRWEEKALIEKAKSMEIDMREVDAKTIVLDLAKSKAKFYGDFGDLVLQRCISHYRGINASAFLEAEGIRVINSSHVSELCGSKLTTTLALYKANIPTPRTAVAFTPESAMEAIESIGYPVVAKPVVGSWGRMIVCLRDREQAQTFIELRSQMEGIFNQIYYVQEMIRRPPRDIRCIVVGSKLVTAVYRIAPEGEWRTNVARGGSTETCLITEQLEDLALRAAEAVGGGVLGVDMMEDKDGLVVHEINSTVEFRGAQSASSTDIAGAIINYAVEQVSR